MLLPCIPSEKPCQGSQPSPAVCICEDLRLVYTIEASGSYSRTAPHRQV